MVYGWPGSRRVVQKDPMHECAVYYRDFMTHTINEFGIPLSKLIESMLDTCKSGNRKRVSKKYPIAAKNGMLRNLFLVQYSRWIVEFQNN